MKQIDWVKDLEYKQQKEKELKEMRKVNEGLAYWKTYYRNMFDINATGASTTPSSWKYYSGTGTTT